MKMRKPMQMIRKKLTSGLALCAVCALIAASLSGCGNRSGSGSSVEPEEESLDASYRDVDSGFGVSDNVVSYNYDYDDAASSVSSTSASSGSTSGSTRVSSDVSSQKLIRTVSMNLETTMFDDLILNLEERAGEMGGYVESSNESISSGENEKRWANMTIRIPEDSLDEFLDMVGESANVTYIGESVEDVTLTYVDLDAHIEELRLEQETIEDLLEDAETIEDVIAIQGQLTEIRYELESYESQLNVLENRVSYSTVYLYINEVDRETPAAPATFGERVQTRFSDSIYWLGWGLRSFAVGFLGYFPIIIFAVVIAVAVYLIVWGCIHRSRRLRGVPTRNMRRKQFKETKKEEKLKRIEAKNAEKEAENGTAMIEEKAGENPEGGSGGQSGEEQAGSADGQPGGEPAGSAEGQPGGEPAGSADGQPGGEPAGSADGQPGGEPAGSADGQSGGEPTGSAEGQPGGEAAGSAEGQSGGEPDGSAEGQPRGEPAGSAEGQPGGNTVESADGQPGGNTAGSGEGQPGEEPAGSSEEQPEDKPPELSEEEARRKAEEEFTERWYNPNGPYA